MQPHSISALAVARHILALDQPVPKGGEVQIKYKKWTGTDWVEKKVYHQIKKVTPILRKEEKDGEKRFYWKGINVEVKASDSLSCELQIRRSSSGTFKKGSEKLEVTHGVQHRAGLAEIYKLDRSSIQGEHRNSEKYGSFSGSGSHEGFFKLRCKVRRVSEVNPKDDKYVDIDYIVVFRPSY